MLRADNADQRLTPAGIDAGLVAPERRRHFEDKAQTLAEARAMAGERDLTPNAAAKHGIKINRDGKRRNVIELLAHPGVDFARIAAIWPELGDLPGFAREQLEIDAVYSGYMDRQHADAEAFRRDEALGIPSSLDYRGISGLSNEICEKLERVRPATLGQAARIDGVTPAALTLLLTHVRNPQLRRSA